LRDPLRTIEGVGAAIVAARSSEQQRHLLRALNQAALIIERASDAAIDLLRCQHGVLEPEVSALTLRSLLHEIRIAAHGAQTRARPAIEVLFPEHEAVIRGDRRRLVRIATALLGAVWLPNEEGGAITLAAGLRPRTDDLIDVEIRVALPANSKEPAAIVPSVSAPPDAWPLNSTEDLELHSAALVAHHLGVTFDALEVPRAVLIRLTCPLVALRPKPPVSTPVPAVRPAPVLLVDTPSHPLRALASGLARSGYQPITAQHRDDAMAALFQRAPAAILAATDAACDAPLQFARHLRSTARTSSIPIVLVARALEASQLALARRCVDSVLVAPVNPDDAVRHLNGCLHPERRGTPRPLELY
jgi:CheY-like chemotaxis protein